VRKDGTTFAALITTALIVCQNEVTGLRGLVSDITERNKSEEIVRKSEERYRELANSLPEIVFETDLTGKITFFSNRALEITGFTREELQNGLSMLSFVVPEERATAAVNMKKSMSGKKIGSNEYTLSRKDGTTFPALVSTSPIISENKVTGVRGLVVEITERKKAEEAIRLSEEKYRSLFENASDVILTGDLSGQITSVNNAIKKYGLLKEQVVGRNVREFLSIKDGNRQYEVFQKVGFGKSLCGELEATVAIGKKTFEVKTDPLRIEDRVVGFQTILRDATERKEAEEKLRESEEKYRDIFENARDAICVHDLKGKMVSINKVVEEYGFTQEQIIGKNTLNFIPKKYWPKLIAQLSEIALGKQVEGEIQVNTPVGKRRVEYRSNPIIRGDKVIGVHSVLRDTTERKKIEDALIESQQKFKALFSANPEAVVFLDTDFRVVEANSRFCVLFGYSVNEIKGKIINEVIVPDEATEESKSVRQKILLGPVEIVALRKKKDGSQFHLFLSGGPVVVDGTTIGCMVAYKDISNIITAQEELSNALAKAEVLNEKLNVVGGFTRHDVRNKLSAINGNLYIAEKYARDNPPLQKCLDQIKTAVTNTARLLDFAKDYEMLGSQERVTLDVGKTVDYATSLFSDLKGVKIVNECGGYSVLADSMLSTIFHNLIDNSLKYGQKLTQIKIYIRQNQNKCESIVYEDDGVGIDEERKKRLFTSEPAKYTDGPSKKKANQAKARNLYLRSQQNKAQNEAIKRKLVGPLGPEPNKFKTFIFGGAVFFQSAYWIGPDLVGI
jgi:PAS domain S-box-containing protein